MRSRRLAWTTVFFWCASQQSIYMKRITNNLHINKLQNIWKRLLKWSLLFYAVSKEHLEKSFFKELQHKIASHSGNGSAI